MVSLYEEGEPIVVEAVQRDERARLDDLDGLADRIREWERQEAPGAEAPGLERRP